MSAAHEPVQLLSVLRVPRNRGDVGRSCCGVGWAPSVPKHDAVVRALKGHSGPVTAVAQSPNGKFVATAGSNGNVRVWVVSSFSKDAPRCHTFQVEFDHATALAFIEDGSVRADGDSCGNGDCGVVTTVRCVCSFFLHQVLALATSASKEVLFYHVHSKKPPKMKARFATQHAHEIASLHLPTFPFLPASVFVITCPSGDEDVKVFTIKGDLQARVHVSQGTNVRAAVSRDANMISVAGWSSEAKVRRLLCRSYHTVTHTHTRARTHLLHCRWPAGGVALTCFLSSTPL